MLPSFFYQVPHSTQTANSLTQAYTEAHFVKTGRHLRCSTVFVALVFVRWVLAMLENMCLMYEFPFRLNIVVNLFFFFFWGMQRIFLNLWKPKFGWNKSAIDLARIKSESKINDLSGQRWNKKAFFLVVFSSNSLRVLGFQKCFFTFF